MTGWTYQLARWRDGFEFSQYDTYPGVPISPLGLGRYQYVNDNPILAVDPSGHVSAASTAAAGGIAAGLGADGGQTAELVLQDAEGLASQIGQYEQQVESLAESVGDALPSKIDELETATSNLVSGQQQSLQQAFQQGNTAVGQHFQQLGKDFQDISDEVADLAAPADSLTVQNATIPGASGPGSQIDRIITYLNRACYVEDKYSLPSNGTSLTRVINQLTNAANALQKTSGTLILNVARAPTASELATFLSRLPASVASNVQVVSGAAQAYNAIRGAFR